jgi:hypothetical protein
LTLQPEPPARKTSNPSRDALPASWQRLLALSGVVFAVVFVIGWFASGGDAPDYAAEVVTFLTLIAGTGDDSAFGFGFFPGVLALVIWSIATSIARYREVANTADASAEAAASRG